MSLNFESRISEFMGDPVETLVGFLLLVRWPEMLQHRVVLGVEGFQLHILGFSGSDQDGICKTDAV